ncbi:hypothetical protein VTL71DRAFT_14612 [Oculimacula yallundae]|uniref:Oxysterol-binding protein n=1 Tax=Oculimacula yallundae TaxID=86028 RepID=A0ABR4CIZ1_9HELO
MATKSKFHDFLSFLATVRGDLANITSPPHFLAPQSIVEVSTCWTERPALFVAPALESDPQIRALLVLKWILCSLRTQFYVGNNKATGLKKPLNAFLGELFMAQWTDDAATTKTITEQVSHHPPISACYMWNEEHGIRGEGYSRVEMTFSGSINIKQTGHALLHVEKYAERHLIPFPDVKVKGFLSGHLYPELSGKYHIISSSGFISEIVFSGQGLFSGKKNSVSATMYRRDDESKSPIYSVQGQWSDEFTITDCQTGKILDTWRPTEHPAPAPQVPDVNDQDPWETRRAWKETIAALKAGDLQAAMTEKSKLEEAQRAMRKSEPDHGTLWEPLFFTASQEDQKFEELASATGWKLQSERTKGVWRFDGEKARRLTLPYHGSLTPYGSAGTEAVGK